MWGSCFHLQRAQLVTAPVTGDDACAESHESWWLDSGSREESQGGSWLG